MTGIFSLCGRGHLVLPEVSISPVTMKTSDFIKKSMTSVFKEKRLFDVLFPFHFW